ncbi:MAG: PIN domain-containing protein [Nitrospirae bacterium]|nr:PIN domain-containing protein [Nitrospirota bacterium]
MALKVSSDFKNWKHARLLLDTSALLKLIAPDLNEPGTQNLRAYIEAGIAVHTCDYCIGEFLGIMKRKWLSKNDPKKVSIDGYLLSINRLQNKIAKNRLHVHQLSLPKYYDKSLAIVKKYNIDMIDSMLLLYFQDSQDLDLFVTADGELTKAAHDFKLLCWNLIDAPEPPN